MKQIAPIALSALLLALPANAQDSGREDMKEGLGLLEQGAKLLLKGLADEMEPALQDLAEQVEPAMRELLGMIDDFNAYEMPEMLPNGDIIIRRKVPPMPGAGEEDGEIDI